MIAIADHGATAQLETWDSFLEASRSLITPTVYNALRYAKPPSGIRHYRFCGEHLEAFRTVASPAARRIAGRRCALPVQPDPWPGHVGRRPAGPPAAGCVAPGGCGTGSYAAAQAGFMAEVASVLETPWTMSTSADLAFPGTRGERPENFKEAQQFETALFRAVVADPLVP
jgi:hypothetical protein